MGTATQLTQQLMDTLGPQWWNLHVAAARSSAQISATIGGFVVVAALVFAIVFSIWAWRETATNGGDRLFGLSIIWFIAVWPILIGLIVIGTSLSTYNNPEIAVYQNLIQTLSLAIR